MARPSQAKELEGLATFIYEVGQLKRVPRSGWSLLGIDNPESVADHSFRAALIAFLLARMEGGDPGRAVLLALVHDLLEARTNDRHRLAQLYFSEFTPDLVDDLSARLPDEMRVELRSMLNELTEGETTEAKVAHDADRIEGIFQAREYRGKGPQPIMDQWMDALLEEVETSSGRRLVEETEELGPHQWWLEKMLDHREENRSLNGDGAKPSKERT